MVESQQLTKIRKRQLEIFFQRVKPLITEVSEGITVKLHDPKNTRYNHWNDKIVFDQPRLSTNKLKPVTLRDAFYEGHLQYWDFRTNPFKNEHGFLEELHDMLMRFERSSVRPNDFTFRYERPQHDPIIEVADGDEKFDSEKYPKTYKFSISLVWRVK